MIAPKITTWPWAVYRRSTQARKYDKRGVGLSPKLPWFVCPESEADKAFGCAIDPEKNRRYAKTVCKINLSRLSDEEIVANATIIAAAPALAEALNALLEDYQTLASECGHHAIAEQVLLDARAALLSAGYTEEAK